MEWQIDEMARLIDDLLHVPHITTGKLALTRERVTLQAVADAAIDVMGR
jgi:signal transduction histidine kinase